MTPLFYSYACDHCDGLTPVMDRGVGYVVWRNRPPPCQEYVFKTYEDAERWRNYQGLDDHPIRVVRSEAGFQWQQSQGTFRGIELADHLFEIYSDHRFEPGPYRAYLDNQPDAAAAH